MSDKICKDHFQGKDIREEVCQVTRYCNGVADIRELKEQGKDLVGVSQDSRQIRYMFYRLAPARSAV